MWVLGFSALLCVRLKAKVPLLGWDQESGIQSLDFLV